MLFNKSNTIIKEIQKEKILQEKQLFLQELEQEKNNLRMEYQIKMEKLKEEMKKELCIKKNIENKSNELSGVPKLQGHLNTKNRFFLQLFENFF